MIVLALGWIGTACWIVCFGWMHRISSRQDFMLKELHAIARRIERLSKAEHDLIREVHPQVGEIKESMKNVAEAVAPPMPRSRAKIDIDSLGDCALVLRVRDNAAALKAQHQITRAKIAGVIESAPAYDTLGIFYDPTAIDSFDELIAQIRAALKKPLRKFDTHSRLVEIPAHFDLDVAPDLEQIAKSTRLSPNEVVDLYCSVEYRVACLGFTPGFPYLAGLPEKLATPRRATPRKEVPAGSIAIGGKQTGIYPNASPGGWNIIGLTNLRLFDPQREPPAFLRAGDRVRFVRSTS